MAKTKLQQGIIRTPCLHTNSDKVHRDRNHVQMLISAYEEMNCMQSSPFYEN